MLDIVIFSSDSFMPRTRVCIESCKEFLPEAKIHLVPFNNPVNGDYVSGLAKARLEYTRKLIVEGADKVMVLGADCVFYSHPTQFLNTRGYVILVPHVVDPPTFNGAQLYKTGHVNADLMLFTRNSIDILNWLVKQDMKDDSSNGIFYEQTWLSALPFFFEGIGIYRGPAVNYAYFNFHERELRKKEDDSYWIDGDPLVMVQYSGYHVGYPVGISKHYNGPVTHEILELFQDYETRISK